MSQIRNMVFEGGGVRGLGYLGFLQKMSEHKNAFPRLKRVAGTSAGALMASMLALNYNVEEMNKIYSTLDFSKFKDDYWGILRDIDLLIHKYGFYKGDVLYQFIKDVIKYKTNNENITFEELKALQGIHQFKDLYIVGTRLFYTEGVASYETVIFSHETTPKTRLADAIRVSISIPFFFAAMRLKKMPDGSYIVNEKEGHVFVDGGLTNNYPIRIFDKIKYSDDFFDLKEDPDRYNFNRETLGLRVDDKYQIDKLRDKKEPKHQERIKRFDQYVSVVIKTALNIQDENLIDSDDRNRTIFIDCTGVDSTDFELSAAKKQQLLRAGQDAALQYQRKLLAKELQSTKGSTSSATFFSVTNRSSSNQDVFQEEESRKRCIIL